MTTPQCENEEFENQMARLRAGDDEIATAVFRRFVRRLIALASRRFESWMRDRADVEGVVLSAYMSFFIRNNRGDFSPEGWDDLWAILALITIRKCGKRRRFLRAARRDASREAEQPRHTGVSGIPDRAPTPAETAAVRELVELFLAGFDPPERAIIEMSLQGWSAQETAARLSRSENTVRRVRHRARDRLSRWLEREESL